MKPGTSLKITLSLKDEVFAAEVIQTNNGYRIEKKIVLPCKTAWVKIDRVGNKHGITVHNVGDFPGKEVATIDFDIEQKDVKKIMAAFKMLPFDPGDVNFIKGGFATYLLETGKEHEFSVELSPNESETRLLNLITKFSEFYPKANICLASDTGLFALGIHDKLSMVFFDVDDNTYASIKKNAILNKEAREVGTAGNIISFVMDNDVVFIGKPKKNVKLLEFKEFQNVFVYSISAYIQETARLLESPFADATKQRCCELNLQKLITLLRPRDQNDVFVEWRPES